MSDANRRGPASKEEIGATSDAALRNEYEFLRRLFDTARVIILVLDPDGRIVRFNPYLEEVSGRSLANVKGKDWFATFLPERDQVAVRSLFGRAIGGEQTRGNVGSICTTGGVERLIEWWDTTLRDQQGQTIGLLAIGQDVTEREQATRQLAMRERQLREAGRIAGLGCWEWDVRADSATTLGEHNHLFGVSDDYFTVQARQRFLDLVHPDDRDAVAGKLDKAIEQGKDARYDYRIVRPDGRERQLCDQLEAVRGEDDRVATILGATLDITERKASEQALLRAKERAEAADKAKTQFLSRMSHELRTPLNSILGFAQILQTRDEHTPLGTVRDQIDTILKSGWHLLDVINDLLDLSRIESGRIELYIETIGVPDVLRDCAELVRPMAQANNIRLEIQCSEEHPLKVKGDRVRLKQVLLNLLSNAIKYNRPNGSVTIHCASYGADTVRIAVVDSGMGIDPADFPSLFLPFSRLYLDKPATEGTGIGLSIARQLVELMSGRIGVDSQPGRGSTFWLELPSVGEDDARIAALPAIEPKPDVHRLLYIEDSPSHVQLMEQIVAEMAGLELLSAHTPQLGLELARAHRPTIILLDICLPGMDGYAVFDELHADEATRDIPVVAVSASATPHDIERGLRAGFRRYLTKPIDVKGVHRAIRELIADQVG